MGRLYKGKCTICGDTFAARKPTTLLSKMSKHRWKDHKAAMSRRIKAGKASADENPTIQDFTAALQEGVRGALVLYQGMTPRQYKTVKEVMDSLEPLLPLKMVIAWKAIEAVHDIREERKGK